MFLPFQSCRVFFHKYSHAPIHSMYSLLLDQLFNSSKDLNFNQVARFFQGLDVSVFLSLPPSGFHQNLVFPETQLFKIFFEGLAE